MEASGGAGGAGAVGARAVAVSPYRVVAYGGYGAVVRPALPNTNDGVEKVFPGEVTKVFYKKSNLDDVLRKSEEIFHIMNAPFPNPANHGHALHPYSKKYMSRNLPVNLRTRLESTFSKSGRSIPSDYEHLQLVRMPDLGIDIFALHDSPGAIKQLRNIPFHKIYYQIFKLFAQTYSLGKHGYIHYDIRDTNVMVHPKTGEINIIDFDLMRTFDRAEYEFKRGCDVKYQHPPECLMYVNSDIVENPAGTENLLVLLRTDSISRETHKESAKRVDVFRNYRSNLLKYFNKVFESYNIKDETKMTESIFDTNLQNVRHIRRLIESGKSNVFYSEVLKTIDNFGLSLTILQMLALLYPNVVHYEKQLNDIFNNESYTKEDKEKALESGVRQLASELKPIITNNGTSYTDAELYRIASNLLELSGILRIASSFKLRHRPSSLEIMLSFGEKYIEIANAFLNEDDAKVATEYTERVLGNLYPERAAAAAPPASAAVGGAEGGAGGAAAAPAAAPAPAPAERNQGGGRSTRRRKRKFNTRNKRRCARKH
jgi:serine/threonine protein kinase